MRFRTRVAMLAGVMLAAGGFGPVSAAVKPTTPAATSLARIEPKLAADLASAKAGQPLEVLVGANDITTATRAVKAAGLKPMISFEKIGFVGVKASPAAIKKVAAQPGVTYIQGNRQLRTSNDTAVNATRVTDAEAAFTAVGGGDLDGSGIGIAVVDSGMAGDHPMYTDATGKTRLLNIKQACLNLFACPGPTGDEGEIYYVNATNLDTDATALGGHGTHVAAIAGGRSVETSNGVMARGVARNASIYGLGAGAGLFTINAVASLNWVLEHHRDPCAAFFTPVDVAGGCPPIRVVNNSYGSPGEYESDDIFSVISEQLVAEGVVVVWAAGNGDEITSTDPRPNDGTVNLSNPPGQSPVPGVLMIANYDDGNSGSRNSKLNDSSSRGFKGRPETYPDFAAPGTNILAACRPWLPICTSGYDDPNYGEISGTSMAAPHVAGIVALLLQAHPNLTPAQIEDVLEDTAHKFGDPATYEADVTTWGEVRNADDSTSFDKGHGLVDLAAALYKLSNTPDPGPSPTGSCASTELTDPEGDSTALTGIGPKVFPPLPTPDVDLVAARAPQIGDAIRFTMELNDMPDIPRSRGDSARSFFNANGKAYILDVYRRLGTSGAIETGATLSTPDPADTTGLTNIVVGRYAATFDHASDVAYTDLPTSILKVASGDELGALRVLWRRSLEGAAAPADELVGRCPLIVG